MKKKLFLLLAVLGIVCLFPSAHAADVAQIGETKYATYAAAFANAAGGATIKILASATETPSNPLELLMSGNVELTASEPVVATIAPRSRTSTIDSDGMAYIRSASAEARKTLTIGENVTLVFPVDADGLGAMYIGYSSATPADVVVNGRIVAYIPYVGSLSTLTVNPSGSIQSVSEDLIVRWGAAVNVIGTDANWSSARPQAKFGYVELQGGVTTLKDTYADGGAWVHIYDRNSKAPEYMTKLVLENTVLVTGKINNEKVIELDAYSQIVTTVVANKGVIAIDATGLADAVKVIDYTGSGTMTLADYGTINVTGGEAYVENNDLWVREIVPEGAFKVADGFYQNAATYTAATEFYITKKAGLCFFRDLVNSTPVDAFNQYAGGGFTTLSLSQFFSQSIFGGKTVKLLADVDLNNEEWTPIGNSKKFSDGSAVAGGKPIFYGTFDGCGHKVSNLKINNTSYVDKDGAGLFGRFASSAAVKNLTIENVDIYAKSYAGALCGNAGSATPAVTIDNVNIVGDIQINGYGYVGGIVGHGLFNVTNCSVIANAGSGKIISRYWQVGGISGTSRSVSSFTDCRVKNIDIEVNYYSAGGVSGNAMGDVTGCTVENLTIGAYNESPNFDASQCGTIVGRLESAGAILYVTDNLPEGAGQCGIYISPDLSVVGWDVVYDDNGKIVGGTFEKCAAGALADGYGLVLVKPTTTPAIFTAGRVVARVGDLNYLTLHDAVAEAGSGDTITLLADNLSATLAAGQSVTIDNNGHTGLTMTTVDGYEVYVVAGTYTSFPNVPTTVWVDDDYTAENSGGHIWGYNAFATISAALAVVSDCGVVRVAPGTYAGGQTITNSLTFEGANKGVAGYGDRGPESVITSTILVKGQNNTVTFDGFQFAASDYALRYGTAPRTTDLVFKNNLVAGGKGCASYNEGTCNLRDITVVSNKFTVTGSSSALRLENIRNLSIIDNQFSGGYNALQLVGAYGNVLVDGNEISDTRNEALKFGGPIGNGVCSNNKIVNANTSKETDVGAIRIRGVALPYELTIVGNTIENSFNGVAVKDGENLAGSTIVVMNNCLVGNSNAGVYNCGTGGVIDASMNYWGAATGPGEEDIFGTVTYSTYYADEAMTQLVYVDGGSVGENMTIGDGETVTVPGSFAIGALETPVTVTVNGGTLNIGELNLAEGSVLEVINGTLVLGTGADAHTMTGTFTIYNSFGSVYIEEDTTFSGATLALISNIHVAAGKTLTVSGALTLDGCVVNSMTPGTTFNIAVTTNGALSMARTELTDAAVTLAGDAAELRDNTLSNAVITVEAGAVSNRVYHNVFASGVTLTDNGTDTVTEVDGWGNVSSTADALNYLTVSLTADNLDATRTLDADGNLFIQPGDVARINLDVGALNRKISGVEAMLGFSTDFFTTVGSALGAVDPWEYELHELFGSDGVYGKLDAGIGLDVQFPDPAGTTNAGTVAQIDLESITNAVDGVTKFYFRVRLPNDNPQAATRLSGFDGEDYELTPFTLNSGMITVDGTAPSAANFTAGQEQEGESADIFLDEVVTRQGTVTFTVDAADATAGIADEDVKLTLTLRGSDPEVTLPAVLQGAAETNGWMRYTFTTAINAETANGTYDAAVTVLDRSGNASETLAGAFEVQKNQFNVTVALQGAVADSFSREVTFVATGAGGGVLATWVRNISFTDGVGTDALTEAPAGIVWLSAKTGVHLCRRLAVAMDADGQGLADFTGTGAEGRQLLGGDLNGDNAVNMDDFNRLRYYWYTVNTAADIDGDGASNLSDLNILKANWYGVGDPL